VRTLIALLAGALLLTSAPAALAQDYVDTEPAPVGQPAVIDGTALTVTVTAVQVAADPATLVFDPDPLTVAPGDAGLLVELTLHNGEAAPITGRDLDFRLVDATGVEHSRATGVCGAHEDDARWIGNLRPGRERSVTACWITAPERLGDGAFIEFRVLRTGSRFTPFALTGPEATPVASPVATPMSP
jgi:plastocyanin